MRCLWVVVVAYFVEFGCIVFICFLLDWFAWLY